MSGYGLGAPLYGASPTNTNAILQSLLDVFSGLARFKTVSRRLKLWSEVEKNQQPALFVYSPGQTVLERRTGMPGITEMRAEIWIYCWTEKEKDTADSEVDAFLELVKQKLVPSPATGTCTLGLPVTDIRIEGAITTDHGDLDFQGVLLVPLRIIIP